MGTDNLFHKNKIKRSKDLQRKMARRQAFKKILIVCEGEKTEPFYFEDLREHYALHSVDVEIRGDCGTCPMDIFNFAKQRYREEKDAGDPFDLVYCVFDKDGHRRYEQALNALSSATPKNTFYTINSIPCFEYWLLLHFEYTTKPFTALPGNSSGNQAEMALKKFIPTYKKGEIKLFTKLIDQLDRAKRLAEKSLEESERNKTDNPSTHVHKLVQVLQDLKK